MKILYLPHFEFADDTEFCRILRSLPGTADVKSGGIFPAFRYRWQLYIDPWRRLLAYGWRAMRSAPADTQVVVTWTHLVLLPFLLGRLVGFRPKLVLVGFIYTDRASSLVRSLRWAYFRLLLSQVDLVITHASVEAASYGGVFGQPDGKFVFVPLSAHVGELPEPGAGEAIVSAGRSNRDYDTLLEAAEQLNVPIRIICDSFQSRRAVPPNVEVLRNCHQADYLRVLADARAVVIPLKDEELSSGQMVLLHSMALGKPVLVTHTKGIADYVESERTGLTLQRGSAASIVTQVQRLLNDDALTARLGEAARERYRAHHTLKAGLSAIGRLVNERFSSHG